MLLLGGLVFDYIFFVGVVIFLFFKVFDLKIFFFVYYFDVLY